MLEIEIGEFVKTKDKILKIDSFEKDMRNVDCVCFTTGEIYTRELLNEIMTKHSKDIIDLIEVGDIVEVLDHDWTRIFNIDDKDILESVLEDIHEGNWEFKSILTHEQYAQNAYEVEE